MLLDRHAGLQQQQVGFLQPEQLEAIRRLPHCHPLHRQHVLKSQLVVEHDRIDAFVHVGPLASNDAIASTSVVYTWFGVYAFGDCVRCICRTSGPIATQAERISDNRLSTSPISAELFSTLARSNWRSM